MTKLIRTFSKQNGYAVYRLAKQPLAPIVGVPDYKGIALPLLDGYEDIPSVLWTEDGEEVEVELVDIFLEALTHTGHAALGYKLAAYVPKGYNVLAATKELLALTRTPEEILSPEFRELLEDFYAKLLICIYKEISGEVPEKILSTD